LHEAISHNLIFFVHDGWLWMDLNFMPHEQCWQLAASAVSNGTFASTAIISHEVIPDSTKHCQAFQTR
jgi:hypothetical protein